VSFIWAKTANGKGKGTHSAEQSLRYFFMQHCTGAATKYATQNDSLAESKSQGLQASLPPSHLASLPPSLLTSLPQSSSPIPGPGKRLKARATQFAHFTRCHFLCGMGCWVAGLLGCPPLGFPVVLHLPHKCPLHWEFIDSR